MNNPCQCPRCTAMREATRELREFFDALTMEQQIEISKSFVATGHPPEWVVEALKKRKVIGFLWSQPSAQAVSGN